MIFETIGYFTGGDGLAILLNEDPKQEAALRSLLGSVANLAFDQFADIYQGAFAPTVFELACSRSDEGLRWRVRVRAEREYVLRVATILRAAADNQHLRVKVDDLPEGNLESLIELLS